MFYYQEHDERESALSVLFHAINHHEEAVVNYGEGNRLLLEYASSQDRHTAPALTMLRSYMGHNISELDLAEYFVEGTGIDLRSEVDSYVHVHRRFCTTILHIRNAAVKYKEAYRKLGDLKIPIYNYTQLWNSLLWKELLEPSRNSELQSLIRDTTVQKPWPVEFDKMFDILFAPYISHLGEKNDAAYNTTTEFKQAFEPYHKHLKALRENLTMDDDFYL